MTEHAYIQPLDIEHYSREDQLIYEQPISSFEIPLMTKKHNLMEKYVNSYKNVKKNIKENYLQSPSIGSPSQNRRRVGTSSYVTNLIIKDKISPDPSYNPNKQFYVKYSPVQNEESSSRMQILDQMEIQYARLKRNIEGKHNKASQMSGHKFRKQKNNSQSKMTPEQIKSELKKIKINQNGKTFFADLYLLKKARDNFKKEIQFGSNAHKSATIIKEQKIDEENQEEKFIFKKRKQEVENKKTKLLKSKGLHWNVYYEMMALNHTEKKNVKSTNNKFYYDFCPD